MDKTTSSRPCPFCGRDFASLGNHLRHCPDRHGREYEHLLSHKTLSKKSTKKQKETCTKCGGRFNRLDTHLRTSASCKDIPAQMPKVKATNSPASKFPATQPLSELPTTEPISELPTTESISELPTTEPFSELPTTEPISELPTTESISELPAIEPISELLPVEPKDHTTSQAAPAAPAPPHQAHPTPEHYPSPVDLLPVIGLPKEAGEWKEADSFFKVHLVPRMCMEGTVDGMNDVLCKGIYDYFAKKSHNNIPTHQNPNHHHQQSHHHHHQHPSKAHGQHQRTLKAVKEEKRQAKKQLRALRRDGTKSEEVRALAHTFHRLVQRYSKLCQEEKHREWRRSRQCERRDCHKNFWRFTKSLLDEDGHTSIPPTFTRETAETFFASTYSNTDTNKSFNQPAWMPDVPLPNSPFPEEEITKEELHQVIKKCKASSTPSPIDQMHYRIFKNCPSLMPALLHLFNTCWSTSSVPSQWKFGVLHLLGKPAAKLDPSLPSNFRPIALTSCVGKLYTAILKTRWTQFMIANGYLNTAVQKAFVYGVSGCTEHHIKLLSVIEEARQKHKSLAVCWLDLTNAFGSVHHQLIRFSLEHYHALARMVAAVSDLYRGLVGIVRTKEWSTKSFPMEVGVFQGDPLSVIIFNTVMNKLVDTITQSHHHLGYSLSSANQSCNLLQFADDTSLLGKGPAACQALLDSTEQWLDWSGMKPKVPKCAASQYKLPPAGYMTLNSSCVGRPSPSLVAAHSGFLVPL